MVAWIGVAFLAAAGVIVVLWLSARVDGLGRERPFPWIGAVVCLMLGCAALGPWFLRVHLENRLAAAASAFVGTPVDVHCQSFGGASVDAGGDLGYVAFGPGGIPERATLIKREQCNDLSDYLHSDQRAPTPEQIVAVHVLTHESIHMSGVGNEAETECLAVQRDGEMAMLLGATPGAAGDLAESYWRDVYPYMPSNYRSQECGPGLALDAGLASAPWIPAEGG